MKMLIFCSFLCLCSTFVSAQNVFVEYNFYRNFLTPEAKAKMVASEKEIAGYICKKAMRKDDKGTEIVAWFTLEIPIQQGPHGIYGLLGLILGVETKYYSEFAQKVVLRQQMELFKMPLADTYLTLKELSDEAFGRTMENVKQKHSKK